MLPSRFAWTITLFLVGVMAAEGRPGAQAQSVPLESAAVEAWKAHYHFARGLSGTAARTSTNHADGRVSVVKREYQQSTKGALLRLLPRSGSDGKEWVNAHNTRYCFEVGGVRADQRYLLRIYRPQPDAIFSPGDRPVRDSVVLSLNPHYCFADQKLWEAFGESSKIKVLSAARVPSAQGERYRIEFDGQYGSHPITSYRVKGFVLFDPARHWCIDSAQYREDTFQKEQLSSTSNYTTTFDTIPHLSGFHLVSREHSTITGYYHRRQMKLDGTIETAFQVSWSNDTKESPFLLSAFGLPEPMDQPRQARPVSLYLWILAAVAGCGLLALIFRRLARRQAAVQQGA